MKNYIGYVKDHSGSMSNIARAAANDYNDNILALKEASHEHSIDTIVNVVNCGIRTPTNSAAVTREVVNSNVNVLQPIPENSYVTNGTGTPLFDSVGEIIELLSQVPDYNDPEVTFLVMVTTDGGENSSRKWNAKSIASKIRELEMTDRWTFTFRVPRRGASELVRLGIPEHNILEWDQTTKGVQQATAATRAATTQFYAERKTGKKSSKTFYATDLSKVGLNEVREALVPITNQVYVYDVPLKYHDLEIADFMQSVALGGYNSGKLYVKGTAFYQLTKVEKEVQEYKKILILDRQTGDVYAGDNARQMLGLPKYGSVRLVPNASGRYDIFIQSTSLNRKVKHGTKVVYWPQATIDK